MHYPILRQTVLPLVIKKINQINGLENLPNSPFIIAANHQGFLDALVVVSIILKKFNQKTYFFTTPFFWKIFTKFLAVHYFGMIPISEENKSQSIEIAKGYIDKEKIVGTFPEGTRYPEKGQLLKGKTGAVRLALTTRAPLCPWGLINPTGHHIGKAFKSLWNFKKEININIGPPLDLNEYYDKPINKKLLEETTRKLMLKISELCEDKYLY